MVQVETPSDRRINCWCTLGQQRTSASQLMVLTGTMACGQWHPRGIDNNSWRTLGHVAQLVVHFGTRGID